MIQHCRDCDKPMHVKRGDTKTQCDGCKDKAKEIPPFCPVCSPRLAAIMGPAAKLKACDEHREAG